MSFREAYVLMLNGYKIKRPMFKGYWYIDSLDGKMKIHDRNGNILTNGDLQSTVANILAIDWEIINE